jgi:polysaccharide pyruvyl transferase WcaK-like protein
MSDLVGDDFLNNASRPAIIDLATTEYICFQAAPHKVGGSVQEVTDILSALSAETGLQVVLLPIGYAKGHDDFGFLEQIKILSKDQFALHYDLNVWEIMKVIKHSKLFCGTSLHGVITALSFAVPYVGINRKISKLDSFIQDWSTGSLTHSVDLAELLPTAVAAVHTSPQALRENAVRVKALAAENYEHLLCSLFPGNKEEIK